MSVDLALCMWSLSYGLGLNIFQYIFGGCTNSLPCFLCDSRKPLDLEQKCSVLMWSLQKYLHSGVPCTYVRLLFNFPVPVNFNWQVRWIRTCELRFYKMKLLKLHSAWKKYTVSFFVMNFGMCWFISNVHLLNETWHLCSAAIQILIQNQRSIPRLN